ncbi:hypothetical protein M4D70_25960 [Brevibacillus borstelensis]|uniref:hypothetical protein n=1 Tax=Brevibacillus borstelensis TaxID=45462 RepID=UPI0020402D4F|nr:hypothetical protein [Brevibacillus borstelensis]MCM3625617.1 hypothetical protein [Brevibacillus borstelensis]
MAIRQEALPQYDERVNEIIKGLTEGKNRDELAKEFGHMNYKSLDMYMRRRNFTWSAHKQTYVPKVDSIEEDFTIDSSKAGKVIALLKKEDADARTVANRLGFSDHQEMAKYMQGKGYYWCGEEANYVKKFGQIDEAESELDDDLEIDEKQVIPDSGSEGDWNQFLPILKLLHKNKEKLLDLLVPSSNMGKIPRYVINGVAKTKTVQMIHSLDRLVVEFANEKNISQRDLFEVALIDFFRKYGYEQEVEQLLGNKM